MEHKFELTFGYEDKDRKLHRDVTVGKRVTVGDVMVLDLDPRSERPTQRADMYRALSITRFGDLKMPVQLSVLLSLNSVDREDIENGVNRFFELSQGDRTFDYRSATEVRVLFGFDVNGEKYDVVEFGKLTTGRDEVDAEAKSLSGFGREAFLLGRMISKISTSDGTASIEGPLDLDMFKELDTADFQLLRQAAKMAEAFFRIKGSDARKDGRDESGDRDSEGNGADAGRDPEPSNEPDKKLPQGDKGAKSAD